MAEARLCRYAALLMLVLFTPGPAPAGDDRDIDTVKDRITRPLLERELDEAQVERLLKALKADGSWGEIDYHDKTNPVWKTPDHLAQVTVLTLAYKAPKSSLRGSRRLKQGVDASLDYWVTRDFQNPNWWHNNIGVPGLLGPVLLLLDAELTPTQRAKGIEILNRGRLGMTGQNLVWLAEVTIYRGIMESSPDLVESAFRRIANEIAITGGEGIQADYSFHQHGKCLYNHGYGAGFAGDCSRLAGLAAGTRFAFPQEKIDLLASYVLEGSQWMAYGATGDYGAEGREITRPGKNAKYLRTAAVDLLTLPTGRQQELRALADRCETRQNFPLEGNRHFWRSDLMTHLRKNYYTSSRMYSTRLDNTDDPHCDEGLKSHYIADGCNFLFVTGDEYRDIFPIWNWQKIPGATIEQNGVFAGSPRTKGTRDFVGGVSDGQYGLAALDFVRSGLQAHKAWFFFDREYVCLGAGITCPSANRVLTTVNQCYLRGDVTVLGPAGPQRLAEGEHALKSPAVLHHGGVAYLFNSAADLLLRNAPQEGSWRTISASRPKDKIVANVFTLCIDHGSSPKSSTYSYVVCPGMSTEEAAVYARLPDVEVLSNTAEVQAVRHRKLRLAQIAFFTAGSLRIDERTTVAVDNPCLMMVRDATPDLRLSIADPTQKLAAIRIELSGRLQGDASEFDPQRNVSTVTVTLPKNGLAGRSVVKTFRNSE